MGPRSDESGPAAKQTIVWSIAIALLVSACAAMHLLPGHPFTRPLIDLDDKTIVGALERVPLARYFRETLWSKDAFAFPVRDLSFYFDQTLGAVWGVQTYVLTNLVLFLAYALGVWTWLRSKLGAGLALLGFAVVLLHPLNLELVQWVISRKHLLVAVFSLLAVLLVDRLRARPAEEAKPAPRRKNQLNQNSKISKIDSVNQNGNIWRPYHFAALFGLQALSLLSHPTGAFFPLWAGIALWRPAGARKQRGWLIGYLLACAALSAAWLSHVTEENRDYGALLADRPGVSAGTLASKLLHLIFGVGRGAWQLLIPERQAIYFELHDWRSYAGLALFLLGAGALAWFASRRKVSDDFQRVSDDSSKKFSDDFRKVSDDFSREGLLQLALAALLFAPEAAFVMKRTDFVMADRFLFLPLPYLLCGIGLIASGAFPTLRARVTPRIACAAALLIAIPCVALSARAAPRWDSELTLYTSCVDLEGSDRCYYHFVDKLLESGCWSVAPRFEQLEAQLEKSARDPDSLYRADGGLVLGLCMASTVNQPPEQREKALDGLRASGATEESLAFARNLVSIEAGDPFAALVRTTEMFLGAQVSPAHMSRAVVGATLGQLRMLARVPALQPRGIGPALATFEARYPPAEWTPEAEQTGELHTARAMAVAGSPQK